MCKTWAWNNFTPLLRETNNYVLVSWPHRCCAAWLVLFDLTTTKSAAAHWGDGAVTYEWGDELWRHTKGIGCLGMHNGLIRSPSWFAMHFPTPILWSRFLSIFFLNYCNRARRQGQLEALTQFLSENLSEAAFGTPLIATGDTCSDSNSKTQQTWTEDPEYCYF